MVHQVETILSTTQVWIWIDGSFRVAEKWIKFDNGSFTHRLVQFVTTDVQVTIMTSVKDMFETFFTVDFIPSSTFKLYIGISCWKVAPNEFIFYFSLNLKFVDFKIFDTDPFPIFSLAYIFHTKITNIRYKYTYAGTSLPIAITKITN